MERAGKGKGSNFWDSNLNRAKRFTIVNEVRALSPMPKIFQIQKPFPSQY